MDSHDRNQYGDDVHRRTTPGDLNRNDIVGEPARTGSHAGSAATQHGRSRTSMGWLLPLLLLLLVAGAAFWLMNRDRVIDSDETAAVGTSGRTASGTLGSLEAGAAVNLTSVKVGEVVGDRTFWVGNGSDRALVVIPEDSKGAGSRETRERFASGQEVSVSGRVAEKGNTPEGLDEKDREAVREAEGRVIIARTVRQTQQ